MSKRLIVSSENKPSIRVGYSYTDEDKPIKLLEGFSMKKEAIVKIQVMEKLISSLGENLIHKEVRRDLLGMLLEIEESVDGINTETDIVVRNDGSFSISDGTRIPYDGKLKKDEYCVIMKYDSDMDVVSDVDITSMDKYNKVNGLQKEFLELIFEGVGKI
jgi:hypothetical protein